MVSNGRPHRRGHLRGSWQEQPSPLSFPTGGELWAGKPNKKQHHQPFTSKSMTVGSKTIPRAAPRRRMGPARLLSVEAVPLTMQATCYPHQSFKQPALVLSSYGFRFRLKAENTGVRLFSALGFPTEKWVWLRPEKAAKKIAERGLPALGHLPPFRMQGDPQGQGAPEVLRHQWLLFEPRAKGLATNSRPALPIFWWLESVSQ